jgi:hypothetical protein
VDINILLKVSLIAVLHNDIEIFLAGHLYFDAVNKIGVVGQLPNNFQFCFECFANSFIINGYNFSSKLLFWVLSIVDSSNDSKTSLAQWWTFLNCIGSVLKSFDFYFASIHFFAIILFLSLALFDIINFIKLSDSFYQLIVAPL